MQGNIERPGKCWALTELKQFILEHERLGTKRPMNRHPRSKSTTRGSAFATQFLDTIYWKVLKVTYTKIY